MAADLHFSGTDFLVERGELSTLLHSDLCHCGGSGDAEDAVNFVLGNYTITGDKEDCQNYLRGYGAWDDEELQDHDENLKRLVWLAGCNLSEGEDIYFCTY